MLCPRGVAIEEGGRREGEGIGGKEGMRGRENEYENVWILSKKDREMS